MSATGPVRDWSHIALFRTLLQAHAAVTEKARAIVEKQYGLSMIQFDMIAELGGQEPMRMGDLSKKMITSPSSVTRVSKQLEAKGLVQRQRAEHSEREVIASLTPEGDAFFRAHFLVVAGQIAEIFEGRLDAADQRQLAALLTKLT